MQTDSTEQYPVPSPVKKMAYRFLSAFLVVLCTLSYAAPAYAESVYTYPGNPLAPYTPSLIPKVDNSCDPYVPTPKPFASSPRYRTAPYKERPTTIKPKYVRGKNDTFKTSLYLPLRFPKVGGAYNSQSIVMVGSYIYVLYSKGTTTNKGFLVRYNQKLIKKYGLTKGLNPVKLRAAYAGQLAPAAKITKNNKQIKSAKKRLKAKKTTKAQRKRLNKRLKKLKKQRKLLHKKKLLQKRIRKIAKVGPTITIGHGQSLAYNPVKKELWMWRDLHNPDGSWANPEKSCLQRISMKTFKVNARIYFRMKAGATQTPINGMHTLAFDKEGNGYFWRGSKDSNTIYRAQIATKSIKVEVVQGFTRKPGGNGQSLGYNAKNNRLYFVSDGAIMTVPVDKLGSLTLNDLTSTTYKTAREFEGIAFDSQGYGHLLLNMGPEIMRTTTPSR